jgi:GTP pyrophosphokinase
VNWLRIARTRKARSRIRAWLIENDQALAIDRNIVAKRKAAKEEPEEESRKAVDEGIPDTIEIRPSQEDEIDGSRDIAVQGSRGMMIRVAGCCRPVAGDRIVGFVSRGRGIAVHRADCPVVASIPDFEERSVECAWVNPKAPATRRLRVVAKADGAIFSEVENAIRKSGARLLEGRVERDGSFMKGRFAIGAPDRESLKRAVKDLRSLPVICKLEYE